MTRDINAALNIRAKGLAQLAICAAAQAKAIETAVNKAQAEAGHCLPAECIPALLGGEDVKDIVVAWIVVTVAQFQ